MHTFSPFNGKMVTMKREELNHKIERFSAQAAQEEALAKVLMSSAHDKREMVDIIKSMQERIDELSANQTVHNTYNIGHDYIENQQINTQPLRPNEQSN